MAASQFDYAKMQTAQKELEDMGKKIAEFVLNVANEANGVIDGCYTGEAANAYKTAFTNVAESVNTAILDINQKLAEELNTQHEEYKLKEQQMAETVNVTPTV